jgi:L-2-hydroxyglutarate oxidase LhgO
MSQNPTLPASLWSATAIPGRVFPVLSGDLAADVVVVGAGFTGLSAGRHLAERGIRVAVVDAAEPGWGASGRYGSQVIAGLKHDPDKLEGIVTGTGGALITAHVGSTDVACLQCPPSISTRRDRTRRLALPALHSELP